MNKRSTKRIAVYLEIHCNIGSKRAFPTGVLDLLIYLRTAHYGKITKHDVVQFARTECYVVTSAMLHCNIGNIKI